MAQYSQNLIGMSAGDYGASSARRKQAKQNLIGMGGFSQQAARMSALDQMAGTPGMMYAGGNPDFDESTGRRISGGMPGPALRGAIRRTPAAGGFSAVRGLRPIGGMPTFGAKGPGVVGARANVPRVNTPEGAQQYIDRIREIDEALRSKYGTGARPMIYTREDKERDRLAQALRLQGYTSNDQGSWAKTGPRIRRTGRMVDGRMVFEERPMTPAEEAAEAAKAARRGQSMGYRGF